MLSNNIISDLIGIKTDCWSLCRLVYRNLGIFLPRYVDTVPSTIEGIEKAITENKCDFIKLPKPEPWSIVLLKGIRNVPMHVGVVLPDLASFIHSSGGISRISRLSLYKSHIEGFYKYCGGLNER